MEQQYPDEQLPQSTDSPQEQPPVESEVPETPAIAPSEDTIPATPEASTDTPAAETLSEGTEDEDEPKVEHWTPEQKPVSFEERWPTTQPIAGAVDEEATISLFRESYSTVAELLERSVAIFDRLQKQEEDLIKKLQRQGRSLGEKDGNPWLRTFYGAHHHAQINEAGEEALTREESHWAQAVEYEGSLLRAGQPKQKLSGGNHSKEEILSYLSRRAGIGTVFDVPLFRSGLWLRLRNPNLAALASLQHQLAQMRVELGSVTKGLAFSNVSHNLTTAAVDFALQYVIDANVHYNTPSDLKEKIDLLDIPILLWGLAVTLYPKGFAYAHPCVADPEKCHHITKETLNLNRLFWTDVNSLTATQKKLMSKRFTKLTEEEQRQYQSEHLRGNRRLVWFGDTGLTLKVPTAQEYEDSGREWINGIIEMTQGAFNEPPHGTNRDQYISRLGQATQARQYAHWVASIHDRDEDGNEELISDDTDVINETLMHIFSADDFFEQFSERVNEFMDDAVISLVAIPSFNCPACDSPAAEKFHERLTHLVPLDVLTTFFTLVSLKHN